MVKAETWVGGAIGAGAVASTAASVAMGMPTGSMGAQYWESTRALPATIGVFGILSILMLGGVGIAMVKHHADGKINASRRAVIASRRRRRRRHHQYEDEEEDYMPAQYRSGHRLVADPNVTYVPVGYVLTHP